MVKTELRKSVKYNQLAKGKGHKAKGNVQPAN
jgi:hypothetical protein